MKDIREIASLLDDTIKKAEEIEFRKSEKVKRRRQSLRKALSFSPESIHEMTPDSPYYNPYQQTPLGYMPHDPKHWQGSDADPKISAYHMQVRNPDGYREVRAFRDMAKSMNSVISQTVEKIEVVKGGKRAEFGEVRDWQGQKFKKEKINGKAVWTMVHEGPADKHPVELDHNKRKDKLTDELKQRKDGKKPEPSFDDKARAANDKAKDLQDKEMTMREKEVEHKEKMTAMKEETMAAENPEDPKKADPKADSKKAEAKKETGKKSEKEISKEEVGKIVEGGKGPRTKEELDTLIKYMKQTGMNKDLMEQTIRSLQKKVDAAESKERADWEKDQKEKDIEESKTNPEKRRQTVAELAKKGVLAGYALEELKRINPELHYGLKKWTGSFYSEMRAHQQGNTDHKDIPEGTDIGKAVKNLETHFEDLPVYKSGAIVRDLRFVMNDDIKDFLNKTKEGSEFPIEAFSSFTANKYHSADPHIRLVVENNESGRHLGELSTHPSENEVVVPKGTKYKVKSVMEKNNVLGGKYHEVALEEIASKSELNENGWFTSLFDKPLSERKDGKGKDKENKGSGDGDPKGNEESKNGNKSDVGSGKKNEGNSSET